MDQLFLNRLAVELLHERDEGVLADSSDAIQNRVWILVTGLDSFKIEDADGSVFGEVDSHVDVDNTIHRTGDDRNGAFNASDAPAGVCDFRVNSPPSGHQGDFIDSVGPSNDFGASELNVHRLRALIQNKLPSGTWSTVSTSGDGSPAALKHCRHLAAVTALDQVVEREIDQPDQTCKFKQP